MADLKLVDFDHVGGCQGRTAVMLVDVTVGDYVMVPVDELVAYAGNAKVHDRRQIKALKESMRRLGFGAPLVCWHDADGHACVVAGHGRLEAAKALGIDAVPCVFRDDWTDAQRRAYMLADNQTSMMTGWDTAALSRELDELTGMDMASLGFAGRGDADIDDLFEDAAHGGRPDGDGKEQTAHAEHHKTTCPVCGATF